MRIVTVCGTFVESSPLLPQIIMTTN